MTLNSENLVGALDLSPELESGQDVQAQLWIEAQKAWAAALEAELRELTESNWCVDQHNLELRRKIQCLKDNHRWITASKEQIWEQLRSSNSQ